MIELHPAIVHFPVALITIAAVFALISLFTKKEFFKEAAFWNLLFGVIGAIAAVLTGLIEEQSLVHNDEIHQILTKHKFTGFSILILSFSLLTWVWVRKNKFGKNEYLFWALFLLIGTAMTFYQGWLGGRMVFEEGAGVKPMEVHMEQEGDSVKPHSHSTSGHDHSENNQDTSLTKKDRTVKTPHDHSGSDAGRNNIQDTLKKQDSVTKKEKKKELKDMKY
jgi:uncharacterized membrane protein